MKKKMLAWLLVGILSVSGVQMAFAEELSDGSPVDSSYENAVAAEEAALPSDDLSLLLPEDDSVLIQENSDDLSSSEADSSEGFEEDSLLTSEEDSGEVILEEGTVESVGVTINSSVAGDSSGTTVRQADFTEPLEDGVIVGIKGTFVRDEATIQQIVDLINGYRLEACKNAEIDPRNASRRLTMDDYVPITWSAAQEWNAQTRAAEASYYWSHSRPCDDLPRVAHNGVKEGLENLAKNSYQNGMLYAVVNQWYGDEHEDWVNSELAEEGSYTRYFSHYSALISPDNLTIGIGCFQPEVGQQTIAAAFGYKTDSDTTPAAVGQYIQVVQIPKKTLQTAVNNPPKLVEVGAESMHLNMRLYPSDLTGFRFTPLEDATWTSDDPGIASITSSGDVTALSEGIATVNLSWKDRTLSQEIYAVKRPALTSAQNVSNGVRLTFQSRPNVDGYCIYRKSTGSWEAIAAVPADSELLTESGNSLIYVDTTAESGVTYSYSISAYRGSNSSSRQETSYDTTGIKGSHIAGTTPLFQNTKDGIKLSWTTNTYLKGYRIYKKTGNSDYKLIKTLGNLTSFTDKDVSEGTAYSYKVQGYNNYSEAISNEVKAIWIKNLNFEAINNKQGVHIVWAPKNFVQEYRIYRATGKSDWSFDDDGNWGSQITYSDYTKIGTVSSGGSFVDTGVEDGKYYSYEVHAYTNGVESVSNRLLVTHYAFPKYEVKNTPDAIQLDWTEPTETMDQYRIYRKTGTSDYQLLTTLNPYTTTYADSSAKENVTYTYKIVGYQNDRGVVEEEAPILRYPSPTLKSVVNTDKGIRLTWEKKNYIKEYRITRAPREEVLLENENSFYYTWAYVNYTQLAVVTDPDSYLDTSAKKDEYYSYRIEATYKGYEMISNNVLTRRSTIVGSLQAQNLYNGVQITWPDMGFSKYQIYRKTANSEYELLDTVNSYSTFYKDTASLKDNTTYTYKVVGMDSSGNCAEKEISIYYFSGPDITSITNVKNGIRLDWKKKNDAAEYRIYRSPGAYGWVYNDSGTSESYQMAYQNYKQIAVVKDLTTYIDSDVTEDEYYGYRIEISKNGQTATSGEASILHFKFNEFKAENVSGGIELNWDTPYSSEFQIYRKTPDSNYELLDTLNWWERTYTDDSADSGITYTYKIVIQYGKSTAEDVLSITRLSNPVFKSAANSMDGIKLTWNEVAGANGYNIYRVNSNNSLSRIGSVSGETFFVDTNVISGKSYTYAVKAYKGKASSKYNTIRKCFLTGVTAKAFNNKTGMSITWKKVPGVTGYYIYRKPQSGGGRLEKIATAAASMTSYLDTEPLVGGRAYTYAVRAYRGNVLSGYQTSSMRALSVPTLTLSSSSGKVQLKWTKVSGAKGYHIYRKTGNGSYVKIKSVTGVGTVRFTDTGVSKKTTYSYAVRAYNGGALSNYIDKKITVK